MRPMAGLSVKVQRAIIEKVAMGVEYIAGNTDEQRNEWVKSARAGDVLVVADLVVIAEPKKPGQPYPTVDFTAVLAEIAARGARLVEAKSGASSSDVDAWVPAVREAMNLIRGGRRLTQAEARRMGQKASMLAIEKSPVNRWLGPDMAAERERFGSIWRDPVYPSAVAAGEAVTRQLASEGKPAIGNWRTMYRVFGKRVPGPEDKPKGQGIVYFVRRGGSDKIKIGTTTNMDSRINALKHPLTGKLRVLATIPGGRDVEKQMHARFKQYRIAGEWFRLEGELMEFVAKLQQRAKLKKKLDKA